MWALHATLAHQQFGTPTPAGFDHLGIFRTTSTDADGAVTVTFDSDGVDRRAVESRLMVEYMRSDRRTPHPGIPSTMDARMLDQQTVMTCDARLDGGTPFPLYLYDQTTSELEGYVLPPILKKITITADMRWKALTAVRSMGITYDSLFPGLDGLGRATTLMATADLPATMRDVLEDRGPWVRSLDESEA